MGNRFVALRIIRMCIVIRRCIVENVVEPNLVWSPIHAAKLDCRRV